MFWDKVAGIYDLYQIINRKANNKAASICASYINKNDIVLECACGTGIMTRIIAPKCKKIIATDFSMRMLYKARNNLKNHNNIKFQYADINDLNYKTESFDVVIAANVIHLLNTPEKAISELRRVVKQGGIIIIPTYISQEANASARITRLFKKMGANFQNEFSINTYRKFFENMNIDAEYKLAKGIISCCVAIIRV